MFKTNDFAGSDKTPLSSVYGSRPGLQRYRWSERLWCAPPFGILPYGMLLRVKYSAITRQSEADDNYICHAGIGR